MSQSASQSGNYLLYKYRYLAVVVDCVVLLGEIYLYRTFSEHFSSCPSHVCSASVDLFVVSHRSCMIFGCGSHTTQCIEINSHALCGSHYLSEKI